MLKWMINNRLSNIKTCRLFPKLLLNEWIAQLEILNKGSFNKHMVEVQFLKHFLTHLLPFNMSLSIFFEDNSIGFSQHLANHFAVFLVTELILKAKVPG